MTALVADLIMSEKKFKSLPKNVQKALLKGGLASASVERKAYADSDNSLLDKLKARGVKILILIQQVLEKHLKLFMTNLLSQVHLNLY